MNYDIVFLPRGLEQADLRGCSLCGALVAGEDRETHRHWHAVLRAITDLRITDQRAPQPGGRG